MGPRDEVEGLIASDHLIGIRSLVTSIELHLYRPHSRNRDPEECWKSYKIHRVSGCSSMVERQLPKLLDKVWTALVD